MTIPARLRALYDEAKGLDGRLSLVELLHLLWSFILLAVAEAFDLAGSGEQKKQAVMLWVEQMLDRLLAKVGLPWSLFAGPIKRSLLLLADLAIEAAYERLKEAREAPAV